MTAADLRVVPADSLWVGDGDLYGRPLRIAIRGLYPPSSIDPKQRDLLPLAADLDVVFPSFDPIDERPNRFAAWSFRRLGGWDPSPPVRFAFEHAAESPLQKSEVGPSSGSRFATPDSRFPIRDSPFPTSDFRFPTPD